MGEIQGEDSYGTSSVAEIATTLESWCYSARPSEGDALVDRLSQAFPTAHVRRDGGSADALVDDVAVVAAHSLTPALRRDVSALAERFGAVVVYSTACHTTAPNEWREFKHRRSRGDARIQFVERPSRTDRERGLTPTRTVAVCSLALIGIASLLAASLGLFGTAGASGTTTAASAAVPGANAVVVGAATIVGIAVAVGGYLLTRRRFYVALVARLTQ